MKEENALRDCASCHEPRGERTNKVIPIVEIGTDPERTHPGSRPPLKKPIGGSKSWNRSAADDRLDPWLPSPPVDGTRLRALLAQRFGAHLARLVKLPAQRPVTFYRGYDVPNPVVGFEEPKPKAIGPNGEMKNRYFLHDTRVRAEGNGGHLWHAVI
jgi:hypothetical protein